MSVHFTAATQTYTASNGAPGSNFTWCGWIYLDSVPSDYAMFFALESSTSNAATYIEVGINNLASNPELRVFASSGGIGTSFSPTPGTWYCVSLAVTGTSGTIYWGTAPGSLSSATGTISNAGRTVTFVGDDSFGEWWRGRIAAVKMWSAALSQAEIQAELASYTAVRATNLVRVHKLQVPEATDYSGNSNSLTGGTGASTAGDPPIGSPVTVTDRSGAVVAGVPGQRFIVDRVLTDRPVAAKAGVPGQALAVGRNVTDRPSSVVAAARPESVLVGRTVADHPTSALASGSAQTLHVDRVLTDRPGSSQAAGRAEVLIVDRVLVDHPSAASAGTTDTALTVDRSVADRPGSVSAAGPAGEQVTAITPVILVDRPSAVMASGPVQVVVVDRLVSDLPGAVQAATPGAGLAVDRIVTDRPSAALGGGRGQVVVVDVLCHDRPGAARANGVGAQLAHEVTFVDRPWSAWCACPGQQVTVAGPGGPTAGWPPSFIGPKAAPLVSFSGPVEAPLMLFSRPVAAPLVLFSGPVDAPSPGSTPRPMLAHRGAHRRSMPAEADAFVIEQFRALRARRRAAKIRGNSGAAGERGPGPS